MLYHRLECFSHKEFTPVTTLSGVDPCTIPDWVKRRWDEGGLNKVWILGITYLRTGEGWLYLAAVTDADSRRILGWARNSHIGSSLVEKALRMNHTLCGEVSGGVVFLSNRGLSSPVARTTRHTGDWRCCSRSVGRECAGTLRWPRVCGRG